MKYLYEYVWLDADFNFRSKIRIMDVDYPKLNDYYSLKWNYDGSSTGQATNLESEVILKPVKCVNNPLHNLSHKSDTKLYLLLCSTYDINDKPLKSNNFHDAYLKFGVNNALNEQPWYGLEQEYFLLDSKTNLPLEYSNNVELRGQGDFYCGVGTNNIFGRKISEEHLFKCLEAGLTMSGTNAEVAPGQWEFQVGPCVGIEAGHQLWLARYILERIAEKYKVVVSLHPKPLSGNWNGSGCHVNYSTLNMREKCNNKEGLDSIIKAIECLEKKHTEHMSNSGYGVDNDKRMTGEHETSSFDKFSWGIGSRGTSVRIGNDTAKNGFGYFEDRRPASNCDPYVVTSLIYDATKDC